MVFWDIDVGKSTFTYSMSRAVVVKGEVASVARRIVGCEEVMVSMLDVREVKTGEVKRVVGEENVGHSIVI
jgi:hypothetical protein